MIELTYHDDKTLERVRDVLASFVWLPNVVDEMINQLQNAGILFRERVDGGEPVDLESSSEEVSRDSERPTTR